VSDDMASDAGVEPEQASPGTLDAATFEQHRAYLWSIAYRMLGSTAEADDIVQEAWLRAHARAANDVLSERAYLSTIVTRLCLDHWKSARVRREAYVGPWLPEPVRTDSSIDPESISLAFLVLLESLSPLERAVYLLSEVFDYSHAEVSRIVDRDEVSCRQLLHRARERVRAQRPRFAPSIEQHRQLLAGFAVACAQGDLAGLERLLAHDVVATSDGGDKVHAAKLPVRGNARVARMLLGLFRKAPSAAQAEVALVNGLPALVVHMDSRVVAIIDIETDGARILSLRTIANPDKLAWVERQITAAKLPSRAVD
jgi:RNA polymerase sigma-70 factor (ECF subfamily)